MPTTVGAYQAKTQFSQLIERVTCGERIIITRHGVPVALLSPIESVPSRPAQEVIAALRIFRSKHRLEELSVREMIEEGRP
ncbi:MAG: type II toxin-antitoxin system prevent-host-death family antitoxin [Anaerolineaceae bacterium]|nr:type II toxin-antitoxin system prevent-host-death family antitoxin [Anaerolineaceae bacterium]